MLQRSIRGLLLLPAALLLAPAAVAQDTDWVVRADTVYTAAGDPIEGGGHVRVEDGKIVSVGSGRGRGADVLEAAAVTPGLIDLSVRIYTGNYSVEQSTEKPVTLSVGDTVDFYSYRWERELASGVTTVLASPEDRAVMGGYGVAIKTGGEPSLEARLVKEQAALRGSFGSEPSAGNRIPRGPRPTTFYFRRPTTRMGVEWVFRKSFYDAIATERFPDRRTEETDVLMRVVRGELPFFVQAWATQDIRTAVYLKEEFGIPRMFVDAAAEAWREPALLVRSGMGVVLPPHRFQGRTTDGAFFAWDTAKMLHDRGVTFALSGHGSRDVADRLNRQPGYAMRGGLPMAAALAAVTINPARMVGIDDRVGSIEVGKDADLVLWSGTPFEPTSQIIGVLLDGRLVVDPRSTE
ncbi:MAG: amidohydrolase family protein [Planctomycetota bacterium]|nr:amidohydrolase family protein [Planctomycetota bacterium]